MTPKVIVPKWKDELSKTIRIYYSIYCLQTTMELFWNSWTCQWTKGDKNERNNSQPCPSRQIAHAKMKIHTLFTQPHIFPNDFSVEYQVDSLRNISCLMCGHIFWCSAKFCGWNPVISIGIYKDFSPILFSQVGHADLLHCSTESFVGLYIATHPCFLRTKFCQNLFYFILLHFCFQIYVLYLYLYTYISYLNE